MVSNDGQLIRDVLAIAKEARKQGRDSVLEAFRQLAKDICREWPESDSRESIEIADIVTEIARRIDAITAQLHSED